eukprot:scaffold109381_cov36-Phaeocystis_antarctica.AAC.1
MAENRIASRGVWVGVSKSCCMTGQHGSAVARWRGGTVARWHGGAVARWRGGTVARWRGGAVA